MLTGNEPAYPNALYVDKDDHAYVDGMTIRQHFAAMAMQGMLSACRGYDNTGLENLAKCAAQQADALIAELNKP